MVAWCCMCKCSGESMDHLLLHCGSGSGGVEFYLSILWCLLGPSGKSYGSFVWMAQLVGEDVFKSLELSSSLFNVDHMARTKWSYF